MRNLWRKLALAGRLLVVTPVLAVIAVVVFSTMGERQTKEVQVQALAADAIIVVRTTGGMLEVSTLTRNEVFKWSTQHTCPIIDCSEIFGKTISELKVPVHYTYRVPLAATWTLKRRETYYELRVPKEEPKLPAAVELSRLEIRTDKGWFAPNEKAHRESLLKNFGPETSKRAVQRAYIEAQRNEARKTIVEFARQWMFQQGVAEKSADLPIKVLFDGETL